MADFQLDIDSTTVDFALKRVSLVELMVSLDSPRTLTFSQVGPAHWDGSYTPAQSVILYDSTSTPGVTDIVFQGEIVEREADGIPGNERITYKAMGPRYLADQVTVFDKPSGQAGRLPTITYNIKRGEPGYSEIREWMPVGDIIKDLFVNNSDALLASGGAGSATPANNYVEAELTALTIVPSESLTFAGTGFTSAIEQLMEWVPDVVFFIDPTTRKWHFRTREDDSATGIETQDIVLADAASLEVMQDQIRESVEDCATRLVIYGGKKTEITEFEFPYVDEATTPLYMDKGWDDTLEEDWTMQDAFNRRSNSASGGGFDETYTDVSGTEFDFAGSTSSVRITGATFDENVWKYGTIQFGTESSSTWGVRYEHRRITSSTDSSGSYCTINFAPDLLLDPNDVYTVRLVQPVNQEWYVWRKFLVKKIDSSVVTTEEVAEITDLWMAVAGGILSTNVTPTLQAEIDIAGTTMRLNVAAEVVDDGTAVIAQTPLCSFVMSPEDMKDPSASSAGSVTGPDKVFLTAPRVTGTLSAVYPPNDEFTGNPDYEGTAFERFTLRQTREVYVPQWKNDAQESLFKKLAEEQLKAFKDVKIQGSMKIADFNEDFLMRNVNGATETGARVVTITSFPNQADVTPPDVATNLAGGTPLEETTDPTNPTPWDRILVKGVRYSFNSKATPYITTNLILDNNQRPGRTQDNILFAIEHASVFVQVHRDFGSIKADHYGNMARNALTLRVDQRIMDPDLDPRIGDPYTPRTW